MKNIYLKVLLGVMLCGGGKVMGQTTVFIDDFTTSAGTAYSTTPGNIGTSSTWSFTRSGADFGAKVDGGILDITNDAGATANAAGWVYASTSTAAFLSPYNTVLGSNSGPVTWTFNMRQPRTDPAGFGAGSYGVAFILGSTSATAANAGNGYAVVLGNSGSTDPIRLVRYATGLQGTVTDMITSNTSGLTDFGTDYLSIRVVYTPSSNTWELFLRNDGTTAFADPSSGTLVSQGTLVNNTYTGTSLTRMGGYWQGSTVATQPAYFDNVKITIPSSGTTTITAGAGIEPATISSLINTVGASSLNFDFTITDDGATPATDATATQISQLVIGQGTGNDIADWSQAILGAELSDGTNTVAATGAAIGTTGITFASLANSLSTDIGYIADNGNKTYRIRIWLRSALGGTLPADIDGRNIVFNIQNTGVTLAAGGLTASQSVSSAAAENEVTVVATVINYTTQPAPITINVNTNFSTLAVLRAQDANGNTDLGFTSAITGVTNSQSFGMSNAPSGSFASGTYTFPANFQFTTGHATNTTTVAIMAGGLTATSTAITVTPPTPSIAVTGYANNSTYAYGNRAWGSNTDQTFTITNSGTAVLNIASIVVAGTGFSLQGSAPTTVNAGNSATFTVRFTPNAIAAFTGTATINSDASPAAYIINLTGTGTASANSDILADAGYSYTNNIAYASFQNATASSTGVSVGVFKFSIRDGGGSADADNLNTILNSITFTGTNLGNIRAAALFGGATQSTFLANATSVSGTNIVFNALSSIGTDVTALDNLTKDITLRVTFNNTVTDNEQMQFTVTSANVDEAASGSSQFGTFTTQNSIVSGDVNRIEVTATTLAFSSIADGFTGVNLNSFTITARDGLGNTDLDRNENVAITTTGSGMSSSSPYTLINGVVTISNVQFSSLNPGINLTGTITTPSLTGTSNTFNITTASFASGDYRTNPLFTGSYYFNSHTADAFGEYPWQSWSGSGWVNVTTSGGTPQNLATKPPTIYLNGTYIDVATGSSTAYNNIVIEGSGTLVYSGNTSTGLRIASGKKIDLKAGDLVVSGYMSLAATAILHVHANANFQVSSSSGQFLRNASSIIEIEDYGNFYLQSYLANLWTGDERFHKNSNFYVQEWDGSSSTLLIPTPTSVLPYTEAGVSACFGNLIIDMGGSTNSQTLQLLPNGFSANLSHQDVIFRTAASGGSYAIRFLFNSGGGNYNTTIGRNLIVEETWINKPVSLLNNLGTVNVTVKGNVENHSSFGAVLRSCSSADGGTNVTLNIDGNLILTNSGVFNFNSSTANSGVVSSVVKLKGDISAGTSTLLLSSYLNTSSNGALHFIGTGDGSNAASTQSVSIASTYPNRNQRIDFVVNPTPSTVPYVQLARDLELGASSTLSVEADGTFDFGFNGSNANNIKIVSGAGNTAFSSKQRSTLKITSPLGLYGYWDRAEYTAAGITVNSGNVQGVPRSSRSISPIATFWYAGNEDQKTGDAPNVTRVGIPYEVTAYTDAKVVICDLANNNLSLTPNVCFGVNNTLTVSTTGGKLDIRKGKFIETLDNYLTGSTGTLYMEPGTYYKVVKGFIDTTTAFANLIPRMNGGSFPYIINGGTIELGGNIADNYCQVLRADNSSYDYHNITFSGSNTLGSTFKALSSQTTITDSLYITGSAIVDCRGSAATAHSFVGPGALFMDGTSRIRMQNTSSAEPQLQGINQNYLLTSGVVEFYNSNTSGNQTIRGKENDGRDIVYKEIEITGNKVGQSNDDIVLSESGGKLTIKTAHVNTGNIDGKLQMSNRSIISNNITNTSRVVVEDKATFITNSSKGFSNFETTTTPANNSSIHKNVAFIDLQNGSTVEYGRLAAQDISNQSNVGQGLNGNYYHLTLSGSGNKLAPSTELVVNGNLTGEGAATFLHENGTVSLNGTAAAQTYTATNPFTFNNININNTHSSGVNVASNMSVVRTMAFAAGALKLSIAADKLITLKSDTLLTAQVAAVPPSPFSIDYNTSGKFEIERSLRTFKGWRFLATPIKGGAGTQTITDAWREGAILKSDNPYPGYGTQLTGPGGTTNGFDEASNSASMKWYNSATNAYVNILHLNNPTTDTIARKEGYMVFVRGDRTVSASGVKNATILRTRGQMLTGVQAYSVGAGTYSVISVGNPYPAPIDADSLFKLNTGLVRTYNAWDPSIGGDFGVGGYQSMSATNNFNAVAGGGGGGASSIYAAGVPYRHIQSGQAVYLQNANAAPLVFYINEGMKRSVGSAAQNRGGAADDRQYMRVKLYNAQDIIVDGNAAVFSSAYLPAIDADDALKFTNAAENFGILRAGKKLAVEGRGKVVASDTVFYSMSNLKQDNYKLGIAPLDFNDPALTAFMHDKFLNTKTSVSLTDSSFINFAITADVASNVADRFMLVFQRSTAGPLPVNFVSVAAQRQADRSIAVNWKVANEINIVKYEVERSANGSNFTAILSKDAAGVSQYAQVDLSPLAADNFYRIKAIGLAGDITYSNIVKVGGEAVAASVVVTQVPVRNNQLNVKFTGQAAGNYNLQLSNALGQVIFKTRVAVNGSAELKLINLPKTVAAGTYHLNVSNSGGELVYGESILIE